MIYSLSSLLFFWIAAISLLDEVLVDGLQLRPLSAKNRSPPSRSPPAISSRNLVQGSRSLLRNRSCNQPSLHPMGAAAVHKYPLLSSSSSSSFLLLSSSSSSEDGLNNSNDSNKNPIRKVVIALRQTIQRMKALPPKMKSNFSKLSRRGKILQIIKAFTMSLLVGWIVSRAVIRQGGSAGSAVGEDGSRRRLGPPVEVPYSQFLELCDQSGKTQSGVSVENLRIGPESMYFRVSNTQTTSSSSSSSLSTTNNDKNKNNKNKQMIFYTRKVPASNELIDHLRKNDIPFAAAPRPRGNTIGLVLRGGVLSFYMLILWRMYKTFGGKSGSEDAPGKLATPYASSRTATSFNDIQGIDNAKEEVMELVDALVNPQKYSILGARAPTGLLLEGPPGTGKTLLARATATAAGVPLLYCSGSDFVEMFVGRGAARVRKLFERATKLSPCIIFVDELDALGKSRDLGGTLGGLGGRGNDEAEQTLNQLLACMDGLDSNKGICVLAATNRKEVLDPALIRPGRFDRIVSLQLPDVKGRENILRVHARKLPGFQEGRGIDDKRVNSLGVGVKVDLSAVAAVTSGFSGAELEFLVNEAAIRAVRRVSAALRENSSNTETIPNVTPEDFEASLSNFYATRKSKGTGLDDVWKNVWRQ